MLRQVLIAAGFLGSGLLVGSGVVNFQQWTRSSQAEARIQRLEGDLDSAKDESERLKGELHAAEHQAAGLKSRVTEVETDAAARLKTVNELRTKIAQVEAQNEELEKVADRAVALSDEVAELKLQQAGMNQPRPLDQLATTEAERPELVQVNRREASERGATSPAFDDSGWKSVAPVSAAARPVAPAEGTPVVPYSVGFPYQGVIILPPY